MTFTWGNSRVGAGDIFCIDEEVSFFTGKGIGQYASILLFPLHLEPFLERPYWADNAHLPLTFLCLSVFVSVFYESRVAIFTSVFSYAC